jgi:hypothetical protein
LAPLPPPHRDRNGLVISRLIERARPSDLSLLLLARNLAEPRGHQKIATPSAAAEVSCGRSRLGAPILRAILKISLRFAPSPLIAARSVVPRMHDMQPRTVNHDPAEDWLKGDKNQLR